MHPHDLCDLHAHDARAPERRRQPPRRRRAARAGGRRPDEGRLGLADFSTPRVRAQTRLRILRGRDVDARLLAEAEAEVREETYEEYRSGAPTARVIVRAEQDGGYS